MLKNTKYVYLNNNKKILVIVESGFSGDFKSSIVRDSTSYFSKFSDTLSIQYCQDETFFQDSYFELKDMTFQKYLEIFNSVLSKIEVDKYDKLFYIAHSFQALVILYIYANLKKEIRDKINIILWDPSTSSNISRVIKSDFKLIDNQYENYTLIKDYAWIFSKQIVVDIMNFDFLKVYKSILIKKLIISAEKAGAFLSETYTKDNKNIIYHVIKNSGHMFGVTKCRRELFKLTKNFILDIF